MSSSHNDQMPIWMLVMWVAALIGIIVYVFINMGRSPF